MESTEKKPRRGNPSFGRPSKPKSPTVYRLSNQFTRVMPNGSKRYPVVYILPNTDVIYDPDTDAQRTIRYIPGEKSIWADEQSPSAANKRTSLSFTNGSLVVPPENPQLKLFMDLTNKNASNPNRIRTVQATFEVYNAEREATFNIEQASLQLEAQQMALKMPLDKLLGYARVLGVNINKSTDEIRYDMKVIAQGNPEMFVNGIDDPRNETKNTIFKAEENRIIRLSERKIEWVKGNTTSIITTIPLGIDHVEYFVDLLHSDEGKDIFDSIKKRLSSLE